MYVRIPQDKIKSWESVFDYAWSKYRIDGNAFNGSREYRGSKGGVVFKIVTESEWERGMRL